MGEAKQTSSMAYRITRIVAGNGFLAHLEVCSRAILTRHEDFLDPFSLSAVQPCGVIGSGVIRPGVAWSGADAATVA